MTYNVSMGTLNPTIPYLVVNVNINSNVVSIFQGSSPKNSILISVLLSLANSKY